ncbi:MAG: hypothetical protein U0U66_14720 [Cytophagaceae bacterium]
MEIIKHQPVFFTATIKNWNCLLKPEKYLAQVGVPTTTARVVCLAAHRGVINEKKINAASPTRFITILLSIE